MSRGYIFVPDGSGGLNPPEQRENPAPGLLRPCLWAGLSLQYTEIFEEREQVYLPVYGMKQGDKAFFAIIEKGDSLATIIADVGRQDQLLQYCLR